VQAGFDARGRLVNRAASSASGKARQDQGVRLDAARSDGDGRKSPSAVGTQLLQAGFLGRHRLSVRSFRLNRRGFSV
jgi:hypothetical protein